MSSTPATAASSDDASATRAEAQFRSRMARLSSDPAIRPSRRRAMRERGGLHLGWKSWLVVDGLAALLVVAGVIAWPPVQACRHQDTTTGFYAGDSVNQCIRRGIAERIDRADQRLKAMVRNSGR